MIMKKRNSATIFFMLFVVVLILMIVFPVLVIAAEQTLAEPTIGDVISSLFINYVAPILGSIILILFTFYAKKLLAKLGITLSAEQENYMNSVADTLVRSAEEQAAKAVKESGDKITFTGSAKLASVISGLQEKFPALSDDEAKKIALAAVQKIPGIGLTGNT
jgi:hypothetical protein